MSEATPEAPPPSIAEGGRQRVPLHHEPILPVLLLVAGLALVAAMGWLDDRRQEAQPWGRTLIVLDQPLPDGVTIDDAIPVAIREVPASNYPPSPLTEGLKEFPMGDELIEGLGLDRYERIIACPESRDEFASMLESGRLPEPGQSEVLAGDLTQLDTFNLDGDTHQVVGQLQRSVGAVGFAYVLSECDVERFAAHPDAQRGWLIPAGLDGEAFAKLDESLIVAGATRVSGGLFYGILAGLLLAALGGAIGQWRLFRWLNERLPGGLFHPILAEYTARPILVAILHVYLYGLFFASMIAAAHYPVMQARIVGLISGEFAQGSLSHIGDAYAAGDIPRAAAATFYQNYCVATLLYTFVASILIPLAGVLKNTLSFAVVGFAMGPIWSGLAGSLTYHALTIVIELESYILATFAVCALPINAFFSNGLITGWGRGLKVMASAAILIGVLLAIAAFYEATTLILLGG